jgi:hypothetical protein
MGQLHFLRKKYYPGGRMLLVNGYSFYTLIDGIAITLTTNND